MARKYDFISELYNRTCKTVVANPASWEAFLRSACYNYRLRFDEQLLVHAQRPDATAVLQIDDWNQKFGRWVNRGAHGIAVFEDADQRRQRLVHYFDISDTHPSRFSRRVPIWQMRDEYTAEVIDTLESTFGELNDKETLAVAIESAARNAVEDNIPDYLPDLIYSVKDSFLDGVSEEEITHIFKTAVRNSVAYMTMTRLGIEAGEYFEPDDLRDVVNFTTPATLNALGYATSDIAEMGLAEISRTILALDRQNRIIAEKTKADYNVGKEKTERSPDDERDHLHEAGGLSAPRSDNAGTAGAVDGQVRPDAEEVPEGASQGTLLQPADELRPERASERHGAQSERDGTDADGADGGVGGRDGEPESDGYDELGSEDEQHPEPSAGDRDDGGNLRLDYYDRSHEDKSLPFFGGDDTVREILGTTPHLKASKDEIRAFFEATADEDARISYIKRIFNNDYTEVILSDGRRVGYKTYQNVLQLWEGSYGNSTQAKYLMADEYLSGNVREKLALARKSAELYPEDYTVNVEALERVQPKDLTASEIAVRLGATWLPTEIVEQFMFEFLGTPRYAQWNIKVHFSAYTGEWNIEGKSYDRSNVKAYSTYGTGRINAYKIIEETLNLKDVRIFDYVEDADGKKKAILNKKETAIAQAKQELIKQGFQDWVWSDPERRERLCRLYNDKFNSLRPREYDGSHIVFSGMNPEIELREHQRNAVAHILYGGNTLLAHAVGAGKTFEMVSAAMESKRLGLCSKSLFVVPNHLTEQWASEFLQLYPSANILVATKKDFETKNRKKFCGRIATGDYDAIIIGHSQFEKIPMSIERQRAILEQQLDEVTEGITELKKNRGDNFSVKQLERTKKSVKQKLDKLNDQSKKDDTVTFEELGVDRLFIDESHYYKNLFLFTKMRNVGGIAQTEAMKSSDLFMKCRYLDELTGGRGTVFATGTPISNSMVELYTIQRYLQYNTLVQNNLQHFDAWASTFGETITVIWVGWLPV